MYRAVTLYFLRHGIAVEDAQRVKSALGEIQIRFDLANRTLLNGELVESEIREMRVSNYVSEVAAVPEVRRAMVAQQQEMGSEKGIVMDGRDIGTVVFPRAELKIFLTAAAQIRTKRRYDELQAKGVPATLEDIAQNLQHRDHIDSTREDSPLRKAADAVVIDNTSLDRDAQLQQAIALARQAGAA